MADYPSFDLFSEIDDQNRFVDGKCGSKFDFVSLDEHVDMNAGIPSHGIFDNDAVLADDSGNALLRGDPLLNYFDQNELLELQPASPSHNPETLMPVSLPADSPSSPSSQPEAVTSSPGAPDKPFFLLHTPKLGSSSVFHTKGQCIPLKAEGESVVPVSNEGAKSPVRIIVKTQKRIPSNMVAPIILQKSGRRSLVRIPRADSVTHRSRLQAIRSCGKIRQSTSRVSGASLPRNTRASSQTWQQAAATTSSTSGVHNEPFRSLREKQVSNTYEECCLRMKRKAYELEPQVDPVKERCRQNAINARRNREVKKAHMEELERKVESISRERDDLAGENESLREAKVKLEQQVKHLNNVLRNESKLSSLIAKLGPTNVVLGDVTTSACEEEIVSSASGR